MEFIATLEQQDGYVKFLSNLKKRIKEESSIGLYKKLQIYMSINTQKGL